MSVPCIRNQPNVCGKDIKSDDSLVRSEFPYFDACDLYTNVVIADSQPIWRWLIIKI